nr:MAG TPA: transmembrane protein [Bacteriophage sp.]
MIEDKKRSPGGCLWLFLTMIATAITVTLVTLKLTDQIGISWWLVFSPILLVVGIPTVVFLVMLIVVALGKRGEDVE